MPRNREENREEPATRQLRIAMLAPPWIPVPPSGYGGTEAVISVLADALVALGHHITLFAAAGSRSAARVVTVLDAAPAQIGDTRGEADHVAAAFGLIEDAAADGRPFDIVHDHSGFVAFAMADRLAVPLVQTLHGPFTAETLAFYRRHGGKGWVVGISAAQMDEAPAGLRALGPIPNPIDVGCWPHGAPKDDYLLWVGRLNAEKGPHRAITVARRSRRPLILAGVVQRAQRSYFDARVRPHLDDPGIRYVGEVGGEEKKGLFARAAALLMPIRWPEPFGMVMLEAMACGTPVLAFPEGAASELVEEGLTGFLVRDEDEMAAAVGRLGEIDPGRCRARVVERYDGRAVALRYAAAYAEILGRTARAAAEPAPLDPATP